MMLVELMVPVAGVLSALFVQPFLLRHRLDRSDERQREPRTAHPHARDRARHS